jgi:hypothetical protein
MVQRPTCGSPCQNERAARSGEGIGPRGSGEMVRWARLGFVGPCPCASSFLFFDLYFPSHLNSNFKLKSFGRFSTDWKYNLNILVLPLFIIFISYIFYFFSTYFPPSPHFFGVLFFSKLEFKFHVSIHILIY